MRLDCKYLLLLLLIMLLYKFWQVDAVLSNTCLFFIYYIFYCVHSKVHSTRQRQPATINRILFDIDLVILIFPRSQLVKKHKKTLCFKFVDSRFIMYVSLSRRASLSFRCRLFSIAAAMSVFCSMMNCTFKHLIYHAFYSFVLMN